MTESDSLASLRLLLLVDVPVVVFWFFNLQNKNGIRSPETPYIEGYAFQYRSNLKCVNKVK